MADLEIRVVESLALHPTGSDDSSDPDVSLDALMREAKAELSARPRRPLGAFEASCFHYAEALRQYYGRSGSATAVTRSAAAAGIELSELAPVEGMYDDTEFSSNWNNELKATLDHNRDGFEIAVHVSPLRSLWINGTHVERAEAKINWGHPNILQWKVRGMDLVLHTAYLEAREGSTYTVPGPNVVNSKLYMVAGGLGVSAGVFGALMYAHKSEYEELTSRIASNELRVDEMPDPASYLERGRRLQWAIGLTVGGGLSVAAVGLLFENRGAEWRPREERRAQSQQEK